ncbi:MAG: aromatic ring-hydroxylating dioxygenase subunit alpha [Gammaproteobacteria bacterium]|nr:MAG: aromatic ring-hydroxylating dioxygenase subunit alpha [Gammaproteobacteria bacterium]
MAYNLQTGWVVNEQAPPDSLEAKSRHPAPPIRRIDKERYFSREWMQREWDRLWTRTWLIAGVTSDLREPGDYFTFDIGPESFIITLTPEDGIVALYNVCPHRGNRLVHNDFGSLPNFTCSFHSWQFKLDGELIRITDEETFRPEVVAHRPCLRRARCETRAGLIFINMDENAGPLDEFIGLPDGYLEHYHLDEMFVVRHHISEWAANWKTGVDAFYETYHLHAVHPETQTVMNDMQVQCDLYPNGFSRMIVPLAAKSARVADQDSVDAGLASMMRDAGMDPDTYTGSARELRQVIQQAKRERAARCGIDYSDLLDGQLTDSWATGIFPNVQIGLHAEGAFLMRFLPHPTDPERFYYNTMTLWRPCPDPSYKVPDWMGLPEGTDVSGETRPDIERTGIGEPPNLGLVLDQDSELLPIVQQGLHSRAFEGPLWSEQEIRLRHFHAELDGYINGEK